MACHAEWVETLLSKASPTVDHLPPT